MYARSPGGYYTYIQGYDYKYKYSLTAYEYRYIVLVRVRCWSNTRTSEYCIYIQVRYPVYAVRYVQGISTRTQALRRWVLAGYVLVLVRTVTRTQYEYVREYRRYISVTIITVLVRTSTEQYAAPYNGTTGTYYKNYSQTLFSSSVQ